MSEISTVTDIREYFATSDEQELRQYSMTLYKTMEALKKENDILLEKVSYLESVLSSKASATIIPSSDEEIICIEQINVLKSKSASRELSLDEVKRLDLLIKNLRLIRSQSTNAIDVTDYSNLKEESLVAALNAPADS